MLNFFESAEQIKYFLNNKHFLNAPLIFSWVIFAILEKYSMIVILKPAKINPQKANVNYHLLS